MKKWSEAFLIVLAAMIIWTVIAAVVVVAWKSDLSFQTTGDFILRIEPTKKVVNPFLKIDNWMTLPHGDSEVLTFENPRT